jgi:hypothetical protein
VYVNRAQQDRIPPRWRAIRFIALFFAVLFTLQVALGVFTGASWILLVPPFLLAAAAWTVERGAGNPPARILISSASRWALWIGVPAFLGGVLGPLILMPDSNAGPILGFLFTGPLGVILGGVMGTIRALPEYRAVQSTLRQQD